jgi:4-hydroxybenzoate polyprenyltransferase
MPLENKDLPGMSNYNQRPGDIPEDLISGVSKPIPEKRKKVPTALMAVILLVIILAAVYLILNGLP